MALTLCRGCTKMLYRQDACRRMSGECKRVDGGSTAIHSQTKVTTGNAATAEPMQEGKATAGREVASRPSRRGGSAGQVPDMPKVATAVTSKQGRTAMIHGDRPLTEKDKALLGQVIDAATDALQKRRGRPRLHPDRKVYKAEKERERRAKLKAAKDAEP